MCTCVYIHPVAVATAGGHISGWMNKRPGDPHPQRWREGEGEKQNQISFVCIYFLGEWVWCASEKNEGVVEEGAFGRTG